MFAAQIINNLSDAERPNQSTNVVDKNSMLEPEELGTDVPDPENETGESLEQDNGPHGTQYNEESHKEDPHLDKYDGYAMPSDEEEPKYIQVMQESKISPRLEPPHLEAVNWEPRRTVIWKHYQNTPWIPQDTWEFMPHDGITHIHNCEVCANC